MDPRERFSERAADYARYRPSYAAACVAAIVDGFIAPVVADVGAGTGISSRMLADAGARVVAVEPNAEMRAKIADHRAITVVDGSAESTTLADESVDIVTAFQAYHWFDPDAVLTEARRILQPRGRFAAVWNHRDRTDLFTGAYESIVDRYDESGGRIDRARRSGTVLDDLRRHRWRQPRLVTGSHQRALDWDALIGLARSASYLPKSGAAYAAMEGDLRRLFDTWPGQPSFIYLTDAYIAEVPLE